MSATERLAAVVDATSRWMRHVVVIAACAVAAMGVPLAAAASPSGTELVSLDVDDSYLEVPAQGITGISSDGNLVVFRSGSEPVGSTDTNNASDIVVRDRSTGTSDVVSVSSSGVIGNGDSLLMSGTSSAMSGDGRFVVFVSFSTNLVGSNMDSSSGVYLRDRQTRRTIVLPPQTAGGGGVVLWSADRVDQS